MVDTDLDPLPPGLFGVAYQEQHWNRYPHHMDKCRVVRAEQASTPKHFLGLYLLLLWTLLWRPYSYLRTRIRLRKVSDLDWNFLDQVSPDLKKYAVLILYEYNEAGKISQIFLRIQFNYFQRQYDLLKRIIEDIICARVW